MNSQGKPRKHYSIFCLLLTFLTIPHLTLRASATETEHINGGSTHFCNGSHPYCGELSAEELWVDPWSSEFKAAAKYISYGSLKQDRSFCGAKGAYSGNCIPPKSNDYTKPCAQIYRCRK